MNLRAVTLLVLGVLAGLVGVGPAAAHQMTLSYINIAKDAGKTTAEIKAPFLDLELAIGIDRNLDGSITWGEVKGSLDRIAAYMLSKTVFSAGGPCSVVRRSAEPIVQGGEGYLSLKVDLACPDARLPIEAVSSIFLEIDPTSRVLVSSRSGTEARSYVLSRNDLMGAARRNAKSAAVRNSFLSYVVEGVGHLFGGPDHLLFLLVLIIPAIYANNSFKSVAIGVLLPITGFTLGHALTLTSAASGLIRPPAQLVESLIAVTILLTAIDNIRSFIPGPRSVIAFAFGLIHGFGFASALGALDLSGWQMASALLGFNIGIETGQAVLALAVGPVLFLIRKPARRYGLMPVGVSVLAGLMAIVWIAQRTGII